MALIKKNTKIVGRASKFAKAAAGIKKTLTPTKKKRKTLTPGGKRPKK